jgi:hypothetical protein
VKNFVLLALIFGLLSCKERTPAYVSARTKTLNMSGAAQDVHLPTELFDEIQKVHKPLVSDKEATDQETDTKAKLEIPTEFFDFRVFLAEKTKGVLGGANYELLFGSGGGVLDLKDFVPSDRGTFFLGIKPDLPVLEKEELHIFFLSNSQKWTFNGENFGSGCDVYMDLTSYFTSAMKQDGFVVNVEHGRHVALLAGSYFMAISIKGKLYLSQLTIKDSRYRKLQCR